MVVKPPGLSGPRLRSSCCSRHLVVVQHGLWGSPADVQYVVTAVQQLAGRGVTVLNSDVNAAGRTYDGIDVLGDRLVALILEHTARQPVHKISFIAYSLGGLVARYAVGKLAALGVLISGMHGGPPHHVPPPPAHAMPTPPHPMQAVNFLTFATPHLGSWLPPDTAYARAFNAVLPFTLSRTGRQLVLADRFSDGLPLLACMAAPAYAFYSGLALFARRIAVANVRHDPTVPFCTAAIADANPFQGLDELPCISDRRVDWLLAEERVVTD